MSVFRQPRTNACATISVTTTGAPGCSATARQAKANLPREAARPVAEPWVWTRRITALPTAMAAAATANVIPTLACSTSTPATNGPTSVPRLSTVEVAAFEATSSSGVRVSDGRIAWSVGLISVDEIPTSAAQA